MLTGTVNIAVFAAFWPRVGGVLLSDRAFKGVCRGCQGDSRQDRGKIAAKTATSRQRSGKVGGKNGKVCGKGGKMGGKNGTDGRGGGGIQTATLAGEMGARVAFASRYGVVKVLAARVAP